MKNYKMIEVMLDFIIDNMKEVAKLGESTSCFPVESFANSYNELKNFRKELEGAKKRAADFNIKRAKDMINANYGNGFVGGFTYSDTDSLKVAILRRTIED